MSESIRISNEEYRHILAEKELSSRSINAQAEHWIKIGRAIEQSPEFSYSNIKAVLAGLKDPGELTIEEDAVYMEQFVDSMIDFDDSVKKAYENEVGDGCGVGLNDDDNLVYEKDK